MEDELSIWKSKKSIHIMAVDGIINVNSLFTIAIFLGLATTTTNPSNSLINHTHPHCNPASSVAKHLISCHVYSFSSFLFSSLVASALKQSLSYRPNGLVTATYAHVSVGVLRVGIMVSAVGSVFGCGFLTLALVDFVQIKLGSLNCWGVYSVAAIVPLVVLVPCALVIYVCIVIYAFTR